MSKQQTAVQWLISELTKEGINVPLLLSIQANKMNKEQIIQVAHDNCEGLGDDEAEEYYDNQFN